MIPKTIHYCWLSDNPYPVRIQHCIDTWRQHLPDYDFRLWNLQSFDISTSVWVQQAFERGKYAFAADYIRLYALYNYGGIYLDSDIEVVKSFDDLLTFPYFACTEGNNIIEAGAFGAEAGIDWIGKSLGYYRDREFIRADGSLAMITLPQIIMRQTGDKYRPAVVDMTTFARRVGDFATDKTLYMLPKDYFCAKDMGSGIITRTNNTYCIHHFAMSWISPQHRMISTIKHWLISIFGEKSVYKTLEALGIMSIKRYIEKRKVRE